MLTPGQLEPPLVPKIKFSDLNPDFVTDLPLSQGCNYLLVVVDRLIKYTSLILCFMRPEAPLTSKQVAQLMFQHIIWKFGVPSTLVSDQDPLFTSEVWRELQAVMQCRIALSTVHHPQSDGQIERMNRTVGQLLHTQLLALD